MILLRIKTLIYDLDVNNLKKVNEKTLNENLNSRNTSIIFF
jgi:hypothetical protein